LQSQKRWNFNKQYQWFIIEVIFNQQKRIYINSIFVFLFVSDILVLFHFLNSPKKIFTGFICIRFESFQTILKEMANYKIKADT